VFVLNIFNKLGETNPGLALRQAEILSGEFCGMSASIVHNVRTDFITSGRLRAAGKKRQHKQKVEKCDVFLNCSSKKGPWIL
jgi:hypothetical protein